MRFVDFSNITTSSGIDYTGESWGTAFGDFNNDGWVDIWINNHLAPQQLFLNQQDGSFVDVAREVLQPFSRADNHGAVWLDFDNDGDQDLLQLNGGGGGIGSIPNFFFVNENGRLTDRAAEFNLDYPLGRGRMPLVFDQNNDGLLDVFVGAADRPDRAAPPTLFRQTLEGENRFVNEGSQLGLNQIDGVVGQISYLTGSAQPELIVLGAERIVYQTGTEPFVDITAQLGLQDLRTSDFAIADFNNDLRPDIFQVTDRIQSTFFQDSPNRFKIFGNPAQSSELEQGVDFSTQGNLRIELPAIRSNDIFIGSQGLNPGDDLFRNGVLRLSSLDPNTIGPPPPLNQGLGISIGYDSAEDLWKIRWNTSSRDIFSRVTSSKPIGAINSINFDPRDPFIRDTLLINTPEGFIQDNDAGITALTAGVSVVAADFDNDMDVDLYIVSATKVGNPNNIFYQNLGDGTFRRIGGGAGARGTRFGVGGAAATADINNDGFLDLLVTNGGAFLGNSRTILEDGPTELFLNQRNGNRWIALTLEGRISNRDGIGTQVLATAGGVTQLREQNGGVQFQVQNHNRIHFGLGRNNQVDELEVKWTSGITQTLFNVSARQILKITEGDGHIGQDLIQGIDGSEVFSGKQGRDEIKGAGGNDSLYGDEGNDLLLGNEGNDLLLGGVGKDRLFGNNGNDSLEGGAEHDQLFGGIGLDSLFGGDGDDLIVGGNGRDLFNGGYGQDTFQLNDLSNGLVLIEDFNPDDDLISVTRRSYSDDLSLGILSPAHFALGTSANNTDHRFIYDRSEGLLFFDEDGSGAQSSILVAKFLNRADLKANNLLII